MATSDVDLFGPMTTLSGGEDGQSIALHWFLHLIIWFGNSVPHPSRKAAWGLGGPLPGCHIMLRSHYGRRYGGFLFFGASRYSAWHWFSGIIFDFLPTLFFFLFCHGY